MGVGGGPNKVFGRWDPTAWEGGVADPVEICRSATCYLATFGRYRSNSTSVITEIRKKKTDLSRPAFQRHSLLLERHETIGCL